MIHAGYEGIKMYMFKLQVTKNEQLKTSTNFTAVRV